jgi:hypothetical protein
MIKVFEYAALKVYVNNVVEIDYLVVKFARREFPSSKKRSDVENVVKPQKPYPSYVGGLLCRNNKTGFRPVS